MLPYYSRGGMLTLSFIEKKFVVLSYDIHNFLLRLLGYLILFATHSLRPSTSVITYWDAFAFTCAIYSITEFHLSTYQYFGSSFILNSSQISILLGLDLPSRYPLNLLKMNNTSLLRITATAGT